MKEVKEKELLNKMIRYLRKHNGEELTTAIVAEEIGESLTDSELMDINSKLFSLAPERGLILDNSKYYDMIIGLPFNIPYTVVDTKKLTKEELNEYIDEHFPVYGKKGK